jgi:hypothetical protein
MSLFDEDGSLLPQFSEGEDPNATYLIDWDNIKTYRR